jgi:hypothetical protein
MRGDAECRRSEHDRHCGIQNRLAHIRLSPGVKWPNTAISRYRHITYSSEACL